MAETSADLVVVPEAMPKRLFERAIVGDSMSDTLQALFERHEIDAMVLPVRADGSIAAPR